MNISPVQPTVPEEKTSKLFVAAVCLVAALGGLLFGYDTAVIAGAIGFLQTHFNLDPTMKGWAASSALLGCVVGVSFAGYFSDFVGRKKTLILAGVLFLASAIGTAVPDAFTVFVIFRMIGGIGVGIASMASPMYIAEITPANIRGRMVSINQFAIVSGMLIIYFVNYFIAGSSDASWNITQGWRWMFASGALPSALFLFFLAWVPESPRWLVEQGALDKARHTLQRVGGASFAEGELTAIQTTLAQEEATLGQLLRPGLRKVLGIGLALAILQQVTGINVFLYYAPEILKKLETPAFSPAKIDNLPVFAKKLLDKSDTVSVFLNSHLAPKAQKSLADYVAAKADPNPLQSALAQDINTLIRRQTIYDEQRFKGVFLRPETQQLLSLNPQGDDLARLNLLLLEDAYPKELARSILPLLQTIVVGAVNLLFTIVAIWTVDRLGRKPLMIIGSTGMGLSLLAMGLVAQFQVVKLWVLLFILTYIACFALSVGPVTWVILSEIFPTRIRGRALSVSTFALWTANFIVSQTFPMMDENATLIARFNHGFPFYVYAAFCVLLLATVLWAVPETKGKSLEQIEKMWVK